MNKKKLVLICIIIGVLAIFVTGIILLIKTGWFKNKLIERDLRTMTEEFYSYYYDDNNGDKKAKEYVAQFKDSGLSISLGDLKIFLESRTNKKYNYKNLEKCDVSKTKSIITPKKPFGKKDIDLKFELSCE